MSKALFAEQRVRGWQRCASLPLVSRTFPSSCGCSSSTKSSQTMRAETSRVATCRTVWLSSGDTPDVFKAGNGAYFFYKGRFLNSIVFGGKSEDWERVRATLSPGETSKKSAPRHGDLLPFQQCLATLARRNTAWSSNTVCFPTRTRCKTSSLDLQWLFLTPTLVRCKWPSQSQSDPGNRSYAPCLCLTACPHQNQATTDLFNKEKIFA